MSQPHTTHRQVAVGAIAIFVVVIAAVAVAMVSLNRVQQIAGTLATRDYPAIQLLLAVDRDVYQAQLALERMASQAGSFEQQRSVFDENVEQSHRRFERYAGFALDREEEVSVRRRYLERRKRWLDAADSVFASLAAADVAPAPGQSLKAARESFAAMRHEIDRLQEEIYKPLLAAGSSAIPQQAKQAQVLMLIALGVGLTIGIGVAVTGVRRICADERLASRRIREREVETHRSDYERRLQRGLQFARSEDDAIRVVHEALEEAAPGLRAQLLVADSSNAHLSPKTSIGDADETPLCPVPTPNECPAVQGGVELSFDTSARFDVCPYLKDRDSGPCSANCVPISVMGQAVGVLHAVGPDHQCASEETRIALGAVAAKAGERLGVLRAFAKTRAQASYDPLTGLLNRRSLEEAAAPLLQDPLATVAVAYGDLDHFKRLNDTHGHETGDRSLRLFSGVLTGSIRPEDLAARWGGEEFVIVFPDADATQAARIMNRVREMLASRVRNADVPEFTVSFGVADTSDGVSLDDLVRAADRALLAAKEAGRNQAMRSTDVRDGEYSAAA